MKPRVAPNSITPSAPTFRTPDRCPISSPRAAMVKIVEASRLLTRNSHIQALLLGLYPKDFIPVEELESDERDHQYSQQGIIHAVALMEFSLDESASYRQASEEQRHR